VETTGSADVFEADWPDVSPSKVKILQSAVSLFAAKGYTETSVRELAAAVGLKVSALYYHFPSKNAILEYLLNDYAGQSFGRLSEQDVQATLEKNPTTDGVLACLRLSFPAAKEDYYLKVMCVILQEQHRNPIMRDFVKDIILNAERKIRLCFDALKEIRVLRPDASPDFTMRVISSLLYTYSNRYMLGIGDSTPDYSGPRLLDLLDTAIQLMFQTCAVVKDGTQQ